MTDLSVPTLQFTDFLVFGACAAIFLCAWLLHRQKTYFLCFGVSYAVCAAMAVWFVDFGSYGSIWSPFGWSLAGATFWIGLRLFDGRPAVTGPMIGLFLFPTATHLGLTLAGASPAAVNAGSTIAYAIHEAAAAVYVFQSSPRRAPLRHLIAGALLAIALVIGLPLLPVSEASVRLSVIAIFIVDHITSILLTTAILALEAERAYAAVARMARTDALTGALNRQGLAAETDGVTEAGIIIADLDHFKTVNDRYGHAAGDAVLRDFAARATALLPEGGHLARLGGEEFGIVLPGHDHNATTYLAERLRRAVGGVPVPWNGSAVPITVSIGVAMLRAGEALSESLERADKALYDAKTDGRNRVRVA
ncbi:diguanylate cyclase [Methylobacterium sp. Leaf123]|uniref:GGDEF domain-containing protein n=1 Tax=Methylobacterium sp. Leaf123 TaxID=1736264 RepID=UPI0006FA6211|nr:GGDEF domain-containing protein [Methylobacterium sp. Leaf123]KQQ11708.1 diguanylate cyclase [Methylobacterium sp. Leaf123]